MATQVTAEPRTPRIAPPITVPTADPAASAPAGQEDGDQGAVDAQEPAVEKLPWNEVRLPSGPRIRLRPLTGQDDADVDDIIIQKGWVTPQGVIPNTVALRVAMLRAIEQIDGQTQHIMTADLMDQLLLHFSKIDLAALVAKYVEVQVGRDAFRTR